MENTKTLFRRIAALWSPAKPPAPPPAPRRPAAVSLPPALEADEDDYRRTAYD